MDDDPDAIDYTGGDSFDYAGYDDTRRSYPDLDDSGVVVLRPLTWRAVAITFFAFLAVAFVADKIIYALQRQPAPAPATRAAPPIPRPSITP